MIPAIVPARVTGCGTGVRQPMPQFRKPTMVSILTLASALALIPVACDRAGGSARPLVKPGEQVADMTLTDLEGEQVNIRELIDGKVALVDVWATWCTPCIQAMPHLQSLYNRYRDRGLVVVGIMTDGNATRIGADRVKDLGVTYPILVDEDAKTFARRWGQVSGIPLLVLVDREGRVVDTFVGIGDLEAIDRRIEDLFSNGGAPPASAGVRSTPAAS